MATVSATDAKNKIGDLWHMAEQEPVTVEKNGVAKYQIISTDNYVAVPKEEYERLKPARRAPRFGFAKEQFKGFDTDALMAIDVSAELEGTA